MSHAAPIRRAAQRAAVALTLATVLTLPQAALAQAGPARLVVPYPPGGSADMSARVMAQKMSELGGKPVVVDNKPGGGTIIGAEAVARAPADGQTMFQINPSNIIAQLTIKSVPVDLQRDFTAVSLMAATPLLLVVNPGVAAKSVAELVALAKAQPGKLNFASGGIGGITHLTGEMFKSVTGTSVLHVPYKGSASTTPALVTGEVAMAFNDVPTYLPLVKAGKLRALGITGPVRSTDLPEVPTMTEAGFPSVDAQVWFAIIVPAATPRDTVAGLARLIGQAAAGTDVRERLRSGGVVPVANTPEQMNRMLVSEFDKWTKLVKEVNLQPQ